MRRRGVGDGRARFFPAQGAATMAAVAALVLGHGPGAAAATSVSAAQRETVLRCGNRTPQVWLTFDDSGTPAQVRAIVDILDRYGVRGRFFPIGSWARSDPASIRYISAHGHLLANHTATHVDLTTVSDARVRQEIAGGVTPTTSPRLLRPPYGAGAFTTRINALAAAQGHQVCFWTVDTRDWDGTSASSMVRKVLTGDALTPKASAGGVVLMHLHGRHTAEALPRIITGLRGRGLAVEPLKAPAPPVTTPRHPPGWTAPVLSVTHRRAWPAPPDRTPVPELPVVADPNVVADPYLLTDPTVTVP
jgi:peptidoglycan/xylan/chitin deacetylase (PgdA/CDA1 family)